MQDGKIVILCIDDEQDVLDGLEMMVEGIDDAVFYGALDGAAGVEKFDEVKADVVMIDLMMERIDAGVGAAKKIHRRAPRVPIYMLTSVGEQMAENLNPAEIGLAGVYQKPLEPEHLMQVVRHRREQMATEPDLSDWDQWTLQ